MDEVSDLQQFPVFGGISSEVITELMFNSNIYNLTQGDYLFREGDKATSFFVILYGELFISKRGSGQDISLNYLRRGDCVGEVALFDLLPRTASARATTLTRCIEVSSRQLLDVYKKDVLQFVLFQMNLGRELARRLRDADIRLIELHSQRHEMSVAASLPQSFTVQRIH